ncbi:histidine kinase [Halodesulfovibrio spirochaetisodalis]|uniref:Histidine kinase n=2 Tax=Halodesulfovibrio spirochaetisodalis TaxID=1560234 RepID=A0A1B7XN25_9BACT|nr:histidine kinase [Halodesulfovibrio spirochaetisodalis]
MEFRKFEASIIDFFMKKNGYAIVLTEDTNFTTLLRQTLNKHLGLRNKCFSQVSSVEETLKLIKKELASDKKLLVFIERIFKDKEMSSLVRKIKDEYSKCVVFITMTEAPREQFILLHELGADNFITKPIAINTFIEKVAHSIKPQSKVSQLVEIAKTMLEQGAYEDAANVAKTVLKAKPGHSAALLVMGDAYKGLKKYEQAHKCYMGAGDSAPLFLDPLKKLADLYGVAGVKKRQLDCLTKLDKMSPLNVERKLDIGSIYVDLGNFVSADAYFEGALRQANKEAMDYLGSVSQRIATAYEEQDPQRAEQYLRRALRVKGDSLDKGDVDTFNTLGIVLRKQGKWREAVQEYKRALQVSRKDENLYYNIAVASAEGKDFAQAVACLKKVIQLNQEFVRTETTVAYNMGLIFYKGGEMELARVHLETCLDLDPNHAGAKKVLSLM